MRQTMDDYQTEAGVVAELATKAQVQPQTITIERGDSNKAQALLVPTSEGGFELVSVKPALDAYQKFPERRRGTANLASLASFIAHAKRFAQSGSAVFADTGKNPSLQVVYDYHESGADDVGTARNLGHRATYAFPLSEEWKCWTNAADKPMEQGVFALFLEERLGDVAEPTSDAAKHPRVTQFSESLAGKLAPASKLLELSRGLTIRVDSKVTNAKNLANGTQQLTFEEQHNTDDGSLLIVPTGFVISIPVFAPGAEYDEKGRPRQALDAISVRLRYRVSAGKISWFVSPYRLDLVLRDAITEALDRVRKETGLPVFEGSPER